MTNITFHGGVNEIGGNKILIEDKPKIFLDFGKSFAKEKQYFDYPFIIARDEPPLIELGILPCIDGLYEKDERSCDLAGVFISHPHTDHYDLIRFLKDHLPVYCGEASMNIILAREFAGQSIGEGYTIAKLTHKNGEEIMKDFKPFRTGDIVKDFSPIEVTPVHVDDSIPGAYGFIVETSEPLAYKMNMKKATNWYELVRNETNSSNVSSFEFVGFVANSFSDQYTNNVKHGRFL